MVLFTASNISAPSNTYKITQETVSTDASGSLLNLASLSVIPSLTAPTFVSLNTTVSQSGTVSNQKNTISFSTSAVNLFMSDGTTNTIFDSVYTGLNVLEFMMSRNQYYLMGSDDVMIINVDGVKLLILETTFMNQKLMNSFSFHYIRGKVRCIHRNLATVMNLTDALISVGYKKSTSTALANNFDLQETLVDGDRPSIQIFDLNYVANPSSSTAGSLLEDNTPINYN